MDNNKNGLNQTVFWWPFQHNSEIFLPKPREKNLERDCELLIELQTFANRYARERRNILHSFYYPLFNNAIINHTVN